MRLAEKIAVVTGGGRGIGRGISLRFAREGALVVVAQRDRQSGESLVEEVLSGGGRAVFRPVDVRRSEDIRELFDFCNSEYGRVDVLVNNAGKAGRPVKFFEMSPEDWHDVLATNLDSTFFCAQQAARLMLAAGVKGRIINMGSINSFAAEKEVAAYVASKGAITALTKALAVELAPHGIAVNAVAPGPVTVERNVDTFAAEPYRSAIARGVPMGRAGTPEEVAALALFLASDECGFLTGETILIDGGYLAYCRFD